MGAEKAEQVFSSSFLFHFQVWTAVLIERSKERVLPENRRRTSLICDGQSRERVLLPPRSSVSAD